MVDNLQTPPVKLRYIADMALQVGMYETTWRDLCAWVSLMNITLRPWESSAIISMASAYTMGVMTYNDKNAPAPWIDTEKLNRDSIAQAVRKALGG